MIVVCAIDRPRSAIISTKSRRLSLNRRYQRTHRMTTSRSKCRPSNSSATAFSLLIDDLSPFMPAYMIGPLHLHQSRDHAVPPELPPPARGGRSPPRPV